MEYKKIRFSSEARDVITKIRELVIENTEEAFVEIDKILSEYDKYDLITIAVEWNPTIPRARFRNKNNSQIRASINIIAIDEYEKGEQPSFLKKTFDRVTLSKELTAATDGMPVFRNCMDHEILLSFLDDEGAAYFEEWWEEAGSRQMQEWIEEKQNENA